MTITQLSLDSMILPRWFMRQIIEKSDIKRDGKQKINSMLGVFFSLPGILNVWSEGLSDLWSLQTLTDYIFPSIYMLEGVCFLLCSLYVHVCLGHLLFWDSQIRNREHRLKPSAHTPFVSLLPVIFLLCVKVIAGQVLWLVVSHLLWPFKVFGWNWSSISANAGPQWPHHTGESFPQTAWLPHMIKVS